VCVGGGMNLCLIANLHRPLFRKRIPLRRTVMSVGGGGVVSAG